MKAKVLLGVLLVVCVQGCARLAVPPQSPCDDHSCGPHHNCYHEPSSCNGYICVYSGPGTALIAGGFNGSKYMSDVESLPRNHVYPALPRPLCDNTLVATSEYFYSCGGDDNTLIADCYRLHRHQTDASWQLAQPLPRPAKRHTSVVMGNNNIWHVDVDRIHNFDITTGEYKTMRSPFKAFSDKHCAVSNGNYSYVIGVGRMEDEIWVNTNPQDEKSWHKVANMKGGRQRHACLWYGSNIMITGGSFARLDVEILNTDNDTIRVATPMDTRRRTHAMMLHDGYPTVVGGYDGEKQIDDVESFNVNTGQWFSLDMKLERARDYFGFVEMEPRLGVRGDGQCNNKK